MNAFKAAGAFAAALFVMSAQIGCAAYRKCGFDGCPGDARITIEVRALLNQHADLEGANSVRVQTLDREVYLSGLVDTPYQRQMAQMIAQQAPGVVQVVNMIAVNNAR